MTASGAFGSRALAALVLGACTALPLPGAQAPPAEGPAFPIATPAPRVLIPADTRLYAQPDRRSRVIARVDADVELAVLERRGRWALVRYETWKVWFDTAGDDSPDLGEVETPPALPPDFDAARLARGRRLVGDPAPRIAGTFTLYTDIGDADLLGQLTRLAEQMPDVYARRFGLPAVSPGESPVLVFAREESYRTYAGVPTLGETDPRGHATGGLAALTVADARADDGKGLLVHELAHLLNRRTLGHELEPWLEEGLAEELSCARFRRDGTLATGTLRGEFISQATTCRTPNGWMPCTEHRVKGPQATVNRLAERMAHGTATRLEILLGLPWHLFTDASSSAADYAASALFIRYLLDGHGGRHAAAFRAFLLDVAKGGPSGAGALAERLGTPLSGLDAGYASYVRSLRRDR